MQHAYSMKTPAIEIMWCSPDQSQYLIVHGNLHRFANHYGLERFEKGFAPNGNPSEQVIVVENFNKAPTKYAREQNAAAIRMATAVALAQSADLVVLKGPTAEMIISQQEIKKLASENAELVGGTPSPDKKGLNQLVSKFFFVNPQIPQKKQRKITI